MHPGQHPSRVLPGDAVAWLQRRRPQRGGGGGGGGKGEVLQFRWQPTAAAVGWAPPPAPSLPVRLTEATKLRTNSVSPPAVRSISRKQNDITVVYTKPNQGVVSPNNLEALRKVKHVHGLSSDFRLPATPVRYQKYNILFMLSSTSLRKKKYCKKMCNYHHQVPSAPPKRTRYRLRYETEARETFVCLLVRLLLRSDVTTREESHSWLFKRLGCYHTSM